VRRGLGHPLQLAEIRQALLDAQGPVQAALLGEIAYLPAHRARRPVEHTHRAPVCLEDVHQHADGGGLARAVRAEQTEEVAPVHLKADVIHGDEAVVGLDELVNDNGGIRHDASLSK
jgi:hypothetical protein